MKIAVSLLAFALVVLASVEGYEEGTVNYYLDLSDEAFDVVAQEKFEALSYYALVFLWKVEPEYDRNNQDHEATERNIKCLVGELWENEDLSKEILVILCALRRNKLRKSDGSHRVNEDDGTARYYYGLSDEAFDAIVQERFDALSPAAREFERKVEYAYDQNNQDNNRTQMAIMGLAGEIERNKELAKEVTIVLCALGRNKLRKADGSRRLQEDQGTVEDYNGLTEEAFDAIVQEKFEALSLEAREFESKVEEEFDRCNGDSGCTQMGIMGLVGETQQNAALYKEVAIVLSALGRNKLRREDGSRRI